MMASYPSVLLAAAMMTSLALAMPAPAQSAPIVPRLGSKWGTPAPNMTEYMERVYRETWGDSLKRQDQYNTRYDITDSYATARVDGTDQEVPQFNELFDSIAELCGPSLCPSDTNRKCIPNGSSNQELCIVVGGVFPGGAAQRDAYVTLARTIFNREAQYITIPENPQNFPTISALRTDNAEYAIVAGPGDYSGSNLYVRFEVQETTPGTCPAALETIVAVGATLPEVGSVFGAIGLICESSETKIVTATG